jgi:Cu/Ag efflux protein CusF
MRCAGIGPNKQKQPIKKSMNMTNEKTQPSELRYTVRVWTESKTVEKLKDHAKKVPLYHAEVKELEIDEDGDMTKISIQLRAKGRNEYNQNLALFLINALK